MYYTTEAGKKIDSRRGGEAVDVRTFAFIHSCTFITPFWRRLLKRAGTIMNKRGNSQVTHAVKSLVLAHSFFISLDDWWVKFHLSWLSCAWILFANRKHDKRFSLVISYSIFSVKSYSLFSVKPVTCFPQTGDYSCHVRLAFLCTFRMWVYSFNFFDKK